MNKDIIFRSGKYTKKYLFIWKYGRLPCEALLTDRDTIQDKYIRS